MARAGTERADAERLASERNGRNDSARSLSFDGCLTSRWLPGGKRLVPATSTCDGYRRNVEQPLRLYRRMKDVRASLDTAGS